MKWVVLLLGRRGREKCKTHKAGEKKKQERGGGGRRQVPKMFVGKES